ncbi:hypothetical protein INS49_005479 [Diaporthe citri]|uniref:uncharacterized protein n=1 Tax=Diaporthe citri TaxID=83186 RepID=UPI001C7E5D41|nr:uncharacterized protein INS49_005479 [Diaporthe citri]KAG6353518.1 hypothetical protein INS49_005479 [Diaporthe citri]
MATASPPESQPQASITVQTRPKKRHKTAFSCTECNAAFNRAAHLRRHQRAHQGEKPYSCAYCSLSSSRKDVIVRHTRNFHPGMVPNRAGDGPPTPANADGDTAQTIGSPSSTPVSQDGGSTQTGLIQRHPPEAGNELCPVFSDSGIHFPDLGLFRSGITPLPEPSLREDLVVDIFPPSDPTNSDLWDMLLASVPDITSGALSGHTPGTNLQTLSVGPPLSSEQMREEKKSIFDKKLLHFRFPSRHAAIRYVKAYYEYMDPQLPILHGPTLNAATVSYCKFSLPAITATWQSQEDESAWQEHTDPADFHDTLKKIIAGQTPARKIGDFGFLSLVSAVLDHICSFETLASSQHQNLYESFFNEIVKPVEVQDKMWRIRAARDAMHRPMNTPLIHSAKSLLDSVYYHLYGHHQLTAMKSLLCAPENLNQLAVPQKAFKEPADSATLGKALTRAAEALRGDCRQGLKYLQGVGPYRFAPLTTTPVCEEGLLLCWYLQTRRSLIPVPDPQTTPDLLEREAASEVEAVQIKAVDDLTIFPLEANAEVLRDTSVVFALTIETVFTACYAGVLPQNKAAWIALQLFGQCDSIWIISLDYISSSLTVPQEDPGISAGLIGTFRSTGNSIGNAIFAINHS